MQKQGKINYLIFLILGILLSSCRENSQAEKLIQARNIINDKPEDALILLESVSHPETMDEKDYMLYILTKTDAKIRNKQDITSDTLIFLAQEYFNAKSDPHKAALANFSAGKVSYDRLNDDKALESYLLAEYYARKTNDDLLIAKSLHSIGNLYYIQEIKDTALIRYKEADLYYSKVKDSDASRMLLIHQIGRTYEDMANLDSALVYFEKGSVLAKQLENSEYETTFTFLEGVVLWEKGNYEQGEEYLYKALKETKNEAEIFSIHLNLARLNTRINKPDVAQIHMDEIKNGLSKINKNRGLRDIYTSLIDFYILNKNYDEAFYYSNLKERVIEKIGEENGLEKLFITEKRHQRYIMDKEFAEAQQKVRTIAGIIFGVAFFLVFIAALLLRNKRLKREKENEILQQKIESLTFLQEIYQHIISDWVGIDNEVKKLAKEYGATEEPELYKRIKQLINDIREKSNIRLLENAKAEILKLEHGEEILSLLTEQEQLILYLRQQRYDKKEITAIVGKGINHSYFMDLKRKLTQVGLSEKAIDELLFSRESRM